jgi:AcrR family transcriptional regulator
MSHLQDRILAVARDLYLEKGLRGLSMRHVAARLDVSATAIYRHYRNKEHLLHKVIEEAVKLFNNYMFASLAGRTPEERWRLGGEAYLNFALQQTKYYEVIFMAPHQLGTEGMPEDLKQQSMANFQFLIDRVQELMEAGIMRRDDARMVAVSIWAHSHGLVSLYLAGKMPLDEATFRQWYWDSHNRLMQGLKA